MTRVRPTATLLPRRWFHLRNLSTGTSKSSAIEPTVLPLRTLWWVAAMELAAAAAVLPGAMGVPRVYASAAPGGRHALRGTDALKPALRGILGHDGHRHDDGHIVAGFLGQHT